MTMRERVVLAAHRGYAALRHRRAADVVTAPATGQLDDLGRRRQCLVVTYRRSGEAVPTPVWFGIDGGRLYFRAEGTSGKAKRIRVNSDVRIARCTFRGRPRGAPFEATARILHGDEAVGAERVIQSRYAWGRRLYERWFTLPDGVYVEVTPRP